MTAPRVGSTATVIPSARVTTPSEPPHTQICTQFSYSYIHINVQTCIHTNISRSSFVHLLNRTKYIHILAHTLHTIQWWRGIHRSLHWRSKTASGRRGRHGGRATAPRVESTAIATPSVCVKTATGLARPNVPALAGVWVGDLASVRG